MSDGSEFHGSDAATGKERRVFEMTRYRSSIVAVGRCGQVDEKLDGSIEVRLVLARHLDRERRDVHRLTVVAVDGGVPARTGSLDVAVVVLDANDDDSDPR